MRLDSGQAVHNNSPGIVLSAVACLEAVARNMELILNWFSNNSEQKIQTTSLQLEQLLSSGKLHFKLPATAQQLPALSCTYTLADTSHKEQRLSSDGLAEFVSKLYLNRHQEHNPAAFDERIDLFLNGYKVQHYTFDCNSNMRPINVHKTDMTHVFACDADMLPQPYKSHTDWQCKAAAACIMSEASCYLPNSMLHVGLTCVEITAWSLKYPPTISDCVSWMSSACHATLSCNTGRNGASGPADAVACSRTPRLPKHISSPCV